MQIIIKLYKFYIIVSGDILVFDNQRVMHGRKSYDPSYHRKLIGWYIEWDTLYSRLRVCKIQKALRSAKNKHSLE